MVVGDDAGVVVDIVSSEREAAFPERIRCSFDFDAASWQCEVGFVASPSHPSSSGMQTVLLPQLQDGSEIHRPFSPCGPSNNHHKTAQDRWRSHVL